MNTQRHLHTSPSRQQGVVMLFGLLALVIMMIGAVALIRSMNTSLFNAGNLGFKRDLTNQGELATAMVLRALDSAGALSNDATRRGHSVANNYSATLLANNDQGLPQALISDSVFATVGSSSNDIVSTAQGITVRYVLDRMCASTGLADPSRCTMAENGVTEATNGSVPHSAEHTGSDGEAGAVPPVVVYRLSIRVEGPRRTQAFFQTTLTL
jgi:type IV pilus assembly protein PilX